MTRKKKKYRQRNSFKCAEYHLNLCRFMSLFFMLFQFSEQRNIETVKTAPAERE